MQSRLSFCCHGAADGITSTGMADACARQWVTNSVVRPSHWVSARCVFHIVGVVNGCVWCSSKTSVDVLEMTNIGTETCASAPGHVELLGTPLLRRQVRRHETPPRYDMCSSLCCCPVQVWLSNALGQKLGWAVSWWNQKVVADSLKDSSLPIWVSLARQKVAVYRDIKGTF